MTEVAGDVGEIAPAYRAIGGYVWKDNDYKDGIYNLIPGTYEDMVNTGMTIELKNPERSSRCPIARRGCTCASGTTIPTAPTAATRTPRRTPRPTTGSRCPRARSRSTATIATEPDRGDQGALLLQDGDHPQQERYRQGSG